MGKAATAFLVLAVICSIALAINWWQVNQNIEGWKTRAQVSSEPNDMFEYMSNVKAGMERYGMTRGYAAIIFSTPANDMVLIYKTVGRHVDQAKVLTTMNRNTPEYQTGLDNLRGSIRELQLHAWYYWSIHDGLLLWIATISFWIAGIIFGLLAWS
jgi:hypothetical protein